eukprot:7139325-Prymnesium_polylepis.2
MPDGSAPPAAAPCVPYVGAPVPPAAWCTGRGRPADEWEARSPSAFWAHSSVRRLGAFAGRRPLGPPADSLM